MLKSLFNKVKGLQAFNFIKKRLQHKCLPVNIAKFLRAGFYLLSSSGGCFCLLHVNASLCSNHVDTRYRINLKMASCIYRECFPVVCSNCRKLLTQGRKLYQTGLNELQRTTSFSLRQIRTCSCKT